MNDIKSLPKPSLAAGFLHEGKRLHKRMVIPRAGPYFYINLLLPTIETHKRSSRLPHILIHLTVHHEGLSGIGCGKGLHSQEE
ncbi:hypothetical protein AL00_06435 [Sphingobium indicum F2]|uniref:Uncharacterized protein n=1 Tax=Sphingobium indicum F2 TaxID=1450518 RepID=A0A8E0WTU4_9SPHN|nr:hypothetical protein AL00_06435 [Sphingobium indicum F2]